MRPLTKDEVQTVFAKLVQYLGQNTQVMLDMDPPHVLRMVRNRVFFMSEQLLKATSGIPRKSLMSVGTCLGKFTASGKFHLQVSALEYIAHFAQFKVWLKPQGEGPFLYGNHVVKRYIGKMTENAPSKAGVVVFSPSNIALGFGVLNRGTVELRTADTEAIAVFNQSDVGLYLRKEREIFGGGSAGTDTAKVNNEVPDIDF